MNIKVYMNLIYQSMLLWGQFSFFIINVNMKKKELIRKRDRPRCILEEIFHKW